jgi:hypothetical protein
LLRAFWVFTNRLLAGAFAPWQQQFLNPLECLRVKHHIVAMFTTICFRCIAKFPGHRPPIADHFTHILLRHGQRFLFHVIYHPIIPVVLVVMLMM